MEASSVCSRLSPALRGGSLRLPLLLLAGGAAAFDAQRCARYTEEGLCFEPKTVRYMRTHCKDWCVTEGEVEGGGTLQEWDDDPSCPRWKQAGYCEHEQYTDYMRRACAKVCGLSPVGEEEEGEGEGEGEAAGDFTGFDDAGTTDIIKKLPAADWADAEDSNCRAWANQGLCGSEQYKAYMALHCRRACADPDTAKSESEADLQPTPSKCLGWAKLDMCEQGSPYAPFMELNCAETCANLQTILESELPPSSFVPLLMTIGFIVLLGWATKQTIHRDASISATVGKSWRKLGADVGEEPVIGSGKTSTKSSKRKTPASLKKQGKPDVKTAKDSILQDDTNKTL